MAATKWALALAIASSSTLAIAQKDRDERTPDSPGRGMPAIPPPVLDRSREDNSPPVTSVIEDTTLRYGMQDTDQKLDNLRASREAMEALSSGDEDDQAVAESHSRTYDRLHGELRTELVALNQHISELPEGAQKAALREQARRIELELIRIPGESPSRAAQPSREEQAAINDAENEAALQRHLERMDRLNRSEIDSEATGKTEDRVLPGRFNEAERLRELVGDGQEGYGESRAEDPVDPELEVPPIGEIPEIQGAPEPLEPIDFPFR